MEDEKIIIDNVECKLCKQILKTKTTFTLHLKNQHSKNKKEILLLKIEHGLTENIIFKSDLEKFTNMKHTCIEKYGVENGGGSEQAKEKNKNTCMERYGTTNAGWTEDSQQKIKRTNIDKYGVEYSWQAEQTKEKSKKRCIEKYGVSNPLKSDTIKTKVKHTNLKRYGKEWGLSCDNIQQKITDTCLKKYGTNRAASAPEVREKMEKTSIERYGCWYPQTDEHQKSNYQYRNFTLPSGKIIQVQGYEDIAFNRLLKLYNECDIITDITEMKKEIGEIRYLLPTDGKIHRYFPDFYIKSTKTIIEIKSPFTMGRDIEKNKAKKKTCEDIGFNFEFMIITIDEAKSERSITVNS